MPETPTASNATITGRSECTQVARTKPRRSIKSRTGCEQGKRRKVKCDEKQPTCSRCVSRNETCTGNFRYDAWQIVRPWMEIDHGPPENAALRYWYDKACLNMAMFRPPVNPLSYHLSGLLRHSRALRHTLQCVADAHREHFVAANLTQALQERNLAIVSLQAEVARVQTSPKQPTLLRTMILASLALCVSSGWLDPSGRVFGMEFLFGVKSVIHICTKAVLPAKIELLL